MASNRFVIKKELGDGSFGCVHLAENRETGEIVAIKQMKKKYLKWEDCICLREVKKLNSHENIIKLKEVLREKDGTLAFVFEYMEGNLYQLIKEQEGRKFDFQKVKEITVQILQGLSYMHRHGFFHRDMKPENLLSKGDCIKIADFGLAREIRSRPPYTEYVSTRWYRAPEVILNQTNYSSPIDIWAVGTIMAELFNLEPLFPGNSEIDQIHQICSVLGPPLPSDSSRSSVGGMIGDGSYYNSSNTSNINVYQLFGGGIWPEGLKLATAMSFHFPQTDPPHLCDVIPGIPPEALQLIADMLKFDPQKRPTSSASLDHPWFNDVYRKSVVNRISKTSSARPASLKNLGYENYNNEKSSIDKNVCLEPQRNVRQSTENFAESNQSLNQSLSPASKRIATPGRNSTSQAPSRSFEDEDYSNENRTSLPKKSKTPKGFAKTYQPLPNISHTVKELFSNMDSLANTGPREFETAAATERQKSARFVNLLNTQSLETPFLNTQQQSVNLQMPPNNNFNPKNLMKFDNPTMYTNQINNINDFAIKGNRMNTKNIHDNPLNPIYPMKLHGSLNNINSTSTQGPPKQIQLRGIPPPPLQLPPTSQFSPLPSTINNHAILNYQSNSNVNNNMMMMGSNESLKRSSNNHVNRAPVISPLRKPPNFSYTSNDGGNSASFGSKHHQELVKSQQRHQDLIRNARERFRGPTWPV